MTPIYDNDGTTSYEIGKVYDNDGTTSYQIGKVYDNDGTTNSLIYNSELKVITDGALQNGYQFTNYESNWLSWVGTSGSAYYVVQRAPDQASSGTYRTTVYMKLPTSQFNTLTFKYSYQAHASAGGIYGTALCALRATISGEDGIWNNAIYWAGTNWGGSGSNQTISWDISNINTDVYFQIATRSYSWAELNSWRCWVSVNNLQLT